jgi:hypothetical protein
VREQHSFRMFEDRVLRKIFGSKMEEITGNRRKAQYEEFCDIHTYQILFG